MSTHHFSFRSRHELHTRSEALSVAVVLEGLAALVALAALVGAVCGVLTWVLVRLATLLLS